MAEPRVLERLTASDLFMLLWDDYGWPNQIAGLAILDGTSLLDRDGHLRVEIVRRQLEPRLQLVPRFRQLLVRPRLGLGWPLWVDVPRLDLADHLRVHPLAAPGDQAQLLQACQDLARRRLDPALPLPLYLAGARLLELFPVVPVMGNLTLVVAVLSYAGQLNLTAVADQDGCPDLEVFAQGVRSALDDLARSALVPAS